MEKKNTIQKINDNIKLDQSYINYHKIINMKLPYKFTYLDDWLLKKSKLLLEETKNILKNTKRYKKYERGTIIKVDFGVGLGSEMSEVHFAIVLNKYDNPKNNILTVIPLTSKKSKFNLDLKNLITDLIDEIEEEIKNCNDDKVLDYYKSNHKNTYACCSLITTISKTRILSPINEYDIIGRKKCSDEVLDLIDKDIKDKFQNI